MAIKIKLTWRTCIRGPWHKSGIRFSRTQFLAQKGPRIKTTTHGPEMKPGFEFSDLELIEMYPILSFLKLLKITKISELWRWNFVRHKKFCIGRVGKRVWFRLHGPAKFIAKVSLAAAGAVAKGLNGQSIFWSKMSPNVWVLDYRFRLIWGRWTRIRDPFCFGRTQPQCLTQNGSNLESAIQRPKMDPLFEFSDLELVETRLIPTFLKSSKLAEIPKPCSESVR